MHLVGFPWNYCWSVLKLGSAIALHLVTKCPNCFYKSNGSVTISFLSISNSNSNSKKVYWNTHTYTKWYIKFLCHSKESDSSLRYINSTLDNMCINEGRQKPGSLYGPHYDAWSIPDSDITRANVDPAWDGGTHAGPTLGQVTPSSGSRILYWSYDVALVVKATTSANKTRVQLGSRWMIIKPFKDGEKPDQSEISCAILMNAVRTINRYSKLYSCKYSWCK